MKQIFNIIPGKEDTCTILLYGTIGPWEDVRAEDVVIQLMDAERNYNKINVRINSVGGDVYAGIAIFNALRLSRADITIYIDCIAASTASFIAACGRTVKMNRYAQLMIHRPSSWAEGDADAIKSCAKELEKIEDILCQIYSERTGQDVKSIRATYMDGAEHWLDSSEALSLGFIDEIYDIEGQEPISDTLTAQQRCEQYTTRYLDTIINLLKTDKTKMGILEKLKKMPYFADCPDETAILNRITELSDKYDKVVKECDNLKSNVADYQKKEREAHEKAIKDEVNAAVIDGRIGENQRNNFEALLKTNYDEAHTLLESLSKKRLASDVIDKSNNAVKTAEELLDEQVKNVNKKLKK